MNFDSVDVQSAIIAFIGVIVGAVVTTIVNYYFGLRSESKRRVKEKQKEVYLDFLISLQAFKNSSGDVALFCGFQKSINAVCLYGDNRTSLFVKEYFECLVESANHKTPLRKEDFIEHETKIINAMRKNLGLKKFDSFVMVKFEGN